MLIKLTTEPLRQMLALAKNSNDFAYSNGVLVSPHPTGEGALLIQSDGFHLAAYHDVAAEFSHAKSIFFPKTKNTAKYVANAAKATAGGKIVANLAPESAYIGFDGERKLQSKANLAPINLLPQQRTAMLEWAEGYPSSETVIARPTHTAFNKLDSVYDHQPLDAFDEVFGNNHETLISIQRCGDALLRVDKEQLICTLSMPMTATQLEDVAYRKNMHLDYTPTDIPLSPKTREAEIRQRVGAIFGITMP